jgi:LPXTG-motif cell wall-anchored protein
VVTPANTPPTTPAAPATALPKNLPFTGAMGGPWQPIGGLAALGLAGGAFALVRRSRRRRPLG